ncbi:hypothetical protein [Bacillus manliponensis]|uniref:hypothetical protein n=1 Tax=Bacillus manliponensis TaxID=574376 RepID=UPI003513055F
MCFPPPRRIVSPVVTSTSVHVSPVPVHTASSDVGIQSPFIWQYAHVASTIPIHYHQSVSHPVVHPTIYHYPSIYIHDITGVVNF